ncbi:PIR protein [Plasmodium ovale]|uniref:PIR Superfamily Protein n=2 Tax=Plasmodium ovale TaxID=36330 RepID=A0A1A8WN58_PLAOA|nr:PIR Superfamily Protein [Plasmodium ovale curtisi]SBT84054.1 PIR protein [Plasmodium ovale]
MAGGHPPRGFAYLLGQNPKELFSEIFYQNREIDIFELYKYSQHCKKKIFPKQNTRMKTLCEKVLRYLEKSSVWQKNKSEYDECILLNYWIYDTLDRHFDHNTEDMNHAFGTLQLIWGHLVDNRKYRAFYKKCEPLFNEILNHNDWEKRKELYDYYVDYKTLYGMATGYMPKCKEYYKRIENSILLYEYFEKECSRDEYSCPDFYKKSKNYNPKSWLTNLPCHKEMVAAKAAMASEQTLAQHQETRALGSDFSEHGSGSDTEIKQEDSDIGTKVGKSILGIAPIALIASSLYKFTPLGPWIRKLAGSNHNIIGNGAGDNEFLNHTKEPRNMFFDNGENYISYQPI